MEFKSSAGIFAAGVVTSIAGYVVGGVFAASAAAASSSYYSDSSAGFFWFLAFLGFVTALIGNVCVIKGMYRAMVKIDALPVHSSASAVPAVSATPTPAPVQS